MYDGVVNQVYAALTRVVVASPLPEAAWYSAAEAALTALYALHPSPEHLSAAVLKRLARAAFASQAAGSEEEEQDTAAGGKGGAEGGEAAAEEQEAEAMDADDADEGAAAEGQEAEQPAGDKAEAEGGAAPAASQQTGSQAARSMLPVVPLSRFFFVLGHVALQHLVSGRKGRGVMGCPAAGVPLLLPCWAWRTDASACTCDACLPGTRYSFPLTSPPHRPSPSLPPPTQVFIERAAKAVRRMRLEREKKAAEERAERLAAGRTPGGCWWLYAAGAQCCGRCPKSVQGSRCCAI